MGRLKEETTGLPRYLTAHENRMETNSEQEILRGGKDLRDGSLDRLEM